MKRFKLISLYTLINLTGGFLVFLAWVYGWVGQVIENDISRISYIIAALFALVVLASFKRALTLSNELDAVTYGVESERLRDYRIALSNNSAATRALEIRMFSRLTYIRSAANALVVMGLVGTVVGFIIVGTKINADTASDVAQVPAMVSVLLQGMAVAFYTTLVGALCSLWLSICYQLLYAGTAQLSALLMVNALDLLEKQQ